MAYSITDMAVDDLMYVQKIFLKIFSLNFCSEKISLN